MGQDLAKILGAPASFMALGLDADFDAGFTLQEVERQMTQDRKVLRAAASAHATVIFAESHVEHPVQSILDVPMGPHNVQRLLSAGRETRDIVAYFGRCGRPDATRG